MAQKYIINDNELLMANVEFHSEILGSGKNEQTIGGGYWYFCERRKLWFFYSKSVDFGTVSYAQFKSAILNGWDEDFILEQKCFTSIEYLSNVFKLVDNKMDSFVFDSEINCYHHKF